MKHITKKSRQNRIAKVKKQHVSNKNPPRQETFMQLMICRWILDDKMGSPRWLKKVLAWYLLQSMGFLGIVKYKDI